MLIKSMIDGAIFRLTKPDKKSHFENNSLQKITKKLNYQLSQNKTAGAFYRKGIEHPLLFDIIKMQKTFKSQVNYTTMINKIK